MRISNRQRGALLLEVVVAMGIGVVAVLGMIAIIAAAIQVDGQTRARARGRRAVESKLSEIFAMDRPTFQTACTQTASVFLVFDVPGDANEPRLVTPTGATSLGNVYIAPDPAGDASAFASAPSYQIRVVATWVSQTRTTASGRVQVPDGITYTAVFAPANPPLESP